MHKRQFLKIAAFSGLAGFVNPFQVLQARPTAETFKLPPLPYGYDALEPYIDKATMQFHHDKHHQTYTDKLNAAITGTKYEKMSIEEILKGIGKDDTAIRNNGGGYYNHSLFWKWLSPQNSAGQPSGKLADAMNSAFGSMDSFKEKFATQAGNVFGSGWAWLLADKNGKLSIASTPNQDSPLMSFAESKGTPILGLDVWEHAYYLKYQNLRPDYVKAFWNVVNWKEVDNLYTKSMK